MYENSVTFPNLSSALEIKKKKRGWGCMWVPEELFEKGDHIKMMEWKDVGRSTKNQGFPSPFVTAWLVVPANSPASHLPRYCSRRACYFHPDLVYLSSGLCSQISDISFPRCWSLVPWMVALLVIGGPVIQGQWGLLGCQRSLSVAQSDCCCLLRVFGITDIILWLLSLLYGMGYLGAKI